MTPPAAVDHLWRAAHQLRDDAQALRLHATEDHPERPTQQQSKLVEHVAEASIALAGWVEEALDAAAQAVAANGYPGGEARLRRALDLCADAAGRVAVQLTDELVCSRRLDELSGFARRGSEERAWVAAIKDAVDRVNPSAWAVPFALVDCWRELAQRGQAPAVTAAGPLAADAAPEDSERRP